MCWYGILVITTSVGAVLVIFLSLGLASLVHVVGLVSGLTAAFVVVFFIILRWVDSNKLG